MEAAAEQARLGNLDYFLQLPRTEFERLCGGRDEDGRTLLHSACSGGNEQLVKLLAEGSSDVINAQDDEGWGPLHSCCSVGHTAVCQVLLELGADVRLQNSSGCTPLHYAASKGHIGVVRLLLTASAPVNMRDKTGSTPLLRAAGAGKLEAVKLSVEGGKASIDMADSEGGTPLFVAVTCQHSNIALYLAAKGADLEAETKEKETPLSVAGSLRSALIQASKGELDLDEMES